jgi:hypothetical protein
MVKTFSDFPEISDIFPYLDLYSIERVYFCAVINEFDYVFSENGLLAYKDGQFLAQQV